MIYIEKIVINPFTIKEFYYIYYGDKDIFDEIRLCDKNINIENNSYKEYFEYIKESFKYYKIYNIHFSNNKKLKYICGWLDEEFIYVFVEFDSFKGVKQYNLLNKSDIDKKFIKTLYNIIGYIHGHFINQYLDPENRIYCLLKNIDQVIETCWTNDIIEYNKCNKCNKLTIGKQIIVLKEWIIKDGFCDKCVLIV